MMCAYRPDPLCVFIIHRNNKALESCGNARNRLQSTLQRVQSESWGLWTHKYTHIHRLNFDWSLMDVWKPTHKPIISSKWNCSTWEEQASLSSTSVSQHCSSQVLHNNTPLVLGSGQDLNAFRFEVDLRFELTKVCTHISTEQHWQVHAPCILVAVTEALKKKKLRPGLFWAPSNSCCTFFNFISMLTVSLFFFFICLLNS